jgi:hypothetical protein
MSSINQSLVNGPRAMLIDNNNHVWIIVPGSPGRGDMITVDGKLDETSAFVTGLAFVDNVIWQRNAANDWYGKSLPTDTWTNWVGSSPRSTFQM